MRKMTLSSDLFYLAVKESKNKEIFKSKKDNVAGKPIRKQNTNPYRTK